MESYNKKEVSKNITIEDIAKALGVSKTTVSRAISGKGRISEETRNSVQKYIKEHNYHPNVIAKSLAQSKTFNIGVVLPADSNLTEIPFFQNCLMGVCEIVASLDYDVVVTTATENDISLLKRIINNNKVDGIILTRAVVNDLAAEYLKGVGIPFIVIGSSEDHSIVQIDNNHVEGCKELTSILLKLGYHSLALLGGNQNHIVNTKRYQGFVKAFKEVEQVLNENMIFLDMNNKVLVDRAVNNIMTQEVDCIVCTDDLICSQVLTKLNEEGYSVPKDIKVASFYDSAYLAHHNPPVTSLRIDAKGLGIEAGRSLIDLIEKKEVASKTLLDYEIVLKKSTM